MAIPNHKKITVKCLIDQYSKPQWVHFCYVPMKLWEEFKTQKINDTMTFSDWVETWALEDFKTAFELNNKQDLYTLKNYIWHRAQTQYPHIYSQHRIDMQGWLRVWVCDNMRKELLKNGRTTRDREIAQDIGY